MTNFTLKNQKWPSVGHFDFFFFLILSKQFKKYWSSDNGGLLSCSFLNNFLYLNLKMAESVCIDVSCQNLTFVDVDPRTVRAKISIRTVDP